MSIPTNLAANSSNKDISLSWNAVPNSELKKYNVYRSTVPGTNFSLAGNVNANKTNYSDTNIKKGVAYYYVVTAVTGDGAESGNSSQAFSAVELPPLIPAGIYSWADVKLKCKADANYLKLLTKLSGLTLNDVSRLAGEEKDGMNLKKFLPVNTILTNSTKNYKLLPNYRLKINRTALTDENGNPYVLTKCGNPMKMQIPVTTTSVFIQNIQIFVTNIIMIFPPQVTNIIINAAQPVNSITVAVMPENIRINFGPAFAPPPPDVFIDPSDFGPDYVYEGEDTQDNNVPNGDNNTKEGEPPEDTHNQPPKGKPVEIFNVGNIGGVQNGGSPTAFSMDKSYWVTELTTYHWNNSSGSEPGTIAIKSADGNIYGPWKATGKPGQGGVPNAYWIVTPEEEIPAGDYTVIDSDPSTFAQNDGTGGQGMARMSGIPTQ